MFRNKIPIFLILITLTAFGAIQTFSQETTTEQKTASVEISPKTADAQTDECAQLLDKTLDAFEKLKKAKSDVDAELLTKNELLAKEAAFNQELLKALALLTSSEKRDKSFFRKLLDQLGNVLKAATKPENLATIAGLIVIIRNLK